METARTFDIVATAVTFDKRTERVKSRLAVRTATGLSWDEANNALDNLMTSKPSMGSGYVCYSYYLFDSGREFVWNDTNSETTGLGSGPDVASLPPFGCRADGWSMRDGKPQQVCASCGTWGDHDTDCCKLPELPF